jgi:nitrite reductase/ring-hydroxylating ferredoxin subunit
VAQLVKVATTPEFEGLETAKLVEPCERAITIFKQGGEYYALENECPYRGILVRRNRGGR